CGNLWKDMWLNGFLQSFLEDFLRNDCRPVSAFLACRLAQFLDQGETNGAGARLLVVTHRLEQLSGSGVARNGAWQTELLDGRPQRLRVGRVSDTQADPDRRLDHHADRYRFSVQQGVPGGGLDRVTHGVSEVENGAPPLLALVFQHHQRLDADTVGDRFGQGAGVAAQQLVA